MALIKQKQTGITTVGGLIKALKKYPAELPIGLDLDDVITVWLLTPDDEYDAALNFADARGRVEILGGDPFGGDDLEDSEELEDEE